VGHHVNTHAEELWHRLVPHEGKLTIAEVAAGGGHLIEDYRDEIYTNRLLECRGRYVNLAVVLGGDRQFDALAGKSQHPLVEGGVPVARVGQRVAALVTRRRHLAADGERLADVVAGPQREADGVDAIGEAAAGEDCVFPRQEAEAGVPRAGVNDARP
jgi:hypothetical protein